MRSLTVLYDQQCALCRRARSWLERQSQYVPLRFLAAGGAAARRCFPDLDHAKTLLELTVIGDGGELFRGAKAWVVCLWALREYRSLSLLMHRPGLWWMAKRLVTTVSNRRHSLAILGVRP